MNDNTKNQTREQDKSTARPWSINKNGLEILARTEIGLIPVANLNFGMNPAEDASLIVRAVNSHAALVEALEAARKLLSEPDSGGYCVAPDSVIFTQINAALKLAKGEA